MTVWDRQAETCCQYLKKGRPVHVEGSLKMDTWDDKTTGEKRSKLKVEAERVQFLDRRARRAAEVMSRARITAAAVANRHLLRDAAAPERAAIVTARAAAAPPPAATPTAAPEPEPNHDEDEDIPF